jgi:phage-related protein
MKNGVWNRKPSMNAEDRIGLNDYYTDTTCAGARIARNLIEFVKNHADEHNVALFYWLTHMGNAPAQVLCDKVATRTSFVKYQVSRVC